MSEKKPPPYVSLIMGGYARIDNLDKAAKRELERRELPIVRDSCSCDAVRFGEPKGEIFADPKFIAVMQGLNGFGILFMEDYKQGWSPADHMRELQSRGIITVPFTSIAWRGPGDWFTTKQLEKPKR